MIYLLGKHCTDDKNIYYLETVTVGQQQKWMNMNENNCFHQPHIHEVNENNEVNESFTQRQNIHLSERKVNKLKVMQITSTKRWEESDKRNIKIIQIVAKELSDEAEKRKLVQYKHMESKVPINIYAEAFK